MNCVIITGGSGMVGQNLREAAAAGGWQVLAPTRVQLDLQDTAAVASYFVKARPNAVIHAAGRVGGIQANIAHPAKFLADNVRMGLNVLDAAMAVPGCRVINLASSCIYPAEAPNPLVEQSLLTGPPELTNEGYALAKIAVLRYGEYLNREHREVRVKTLIPCNLYGCHDSFAVNKSHLIPAILVKIHDAAVRGDTAVTIWGDGSARREFALASDVARWVWDALERFEDLPAVMNLGVGVDHSVLEYYEAAGKVVKWFGSFSFDLTQPSGMKRKLVDNGHQRRLGFAAPTSLAMGLHLSYDFYCKSLIQ